MNNYILHLKKIIYIVLFSSAVWFTSFTIFPENQVIKIEVGDVSPNSFSAPRFLSVVDNQKTNLLKDQFMTMNLVQNKNYFNIRYQVKPFMIWIWFSVLIITLGGFKSLIKKKYED